MDTCGTNEMILAELDPIWMMFGGSKMSQAGFGVFDMSLYTDITHVFCVFCMGIGSICSPKGLSGCGHGVSRVEDGDVG